VVRISITCKGDELELENWNAIAAVEDSWGNKLQKLMDVTAHTISQRLRMLKRVPPELIPLGMLD
jgi:hypothetical protein